jgi:hypothetical protein
MAQQQQQQQQGLPRATYGAILRDVDLPVLCCMHLGLLSARYPGWVGAAEHGS